MSGSAKNDVLVKDGRVVNKVTGTTPCIIHANSWDKRPLIKLVTQSHRLTKEQEQVGTSVVLLNIRGTFEYPGYF